MRRTNIAPSSAPAGLVARISHRLLGLTELRQLRRAACTPDLGTFLHAALARLGNEVRIPEHDGARVPADGACLVVANHPFGGLDGLVLLSLVLRVRRDVRILGAPWLRQVPELAGVVLPIAPDDDPESRRANRAPLRAAVAWLNGGGLLAMFPAGAVAARQWGVRGVVEAPWSRGLAGLQRLTAAPVLPVFFAGSNPSWFHAAGLVHPRLRTWLLPRALLATRGRPVTVRIGHLIAPARLQRFASASEATDYLRLRTLILGRRVEAAGVQRGKGAAAGSAAVAPAVLQERLAAAVAALPAAARLVAARGASVFVARAHEIPDVLQEIGRLREITFRAAGEGTGKACDLDPFDATYLHLFVWDERDRAILGAYRMGLSDELLTRGGLEQLYTSTLFRFAPALRERIHPGIELGRSFVVGRAQRDGQTLFLLWRAIGAFVARHPRYRLLFGPVSISAAHGELSRRLIVDHLQAHCFASDTARLVQPRHPLRRGPTSLRWSDAMIDELGEVSALVQDLEPDRKGVPVLVREYIKLGGRFLGFNVDPEFHDAIDALVLVDLRQTPWRLLDRYLGRAGAAHFRAQHGLVAAAAAGAATGGS